MSYFSELLERISDPNWRRRLHTFERVFQRLLPLGGMSSGNQIRVFTETTEIEEEILHSIRQAQNRIWMETYIFEPDAVGLQVRDALCAAAQRGCEVILLYDHFGSSGLSTGFLEPLIQSGARAIDFNPIWPWRRKGPLLFRDHRKIVIIDDRIGFCGSYNIAQSRFRDTVVRIQGPAVADLKGIFLDSLFETTGESNRVCFPLHNFEQGVVVQVLGSNQRRKLVSIQKSMELILKKAKDYCFFTTPYFLPYDSLRRAMIEAAQRGVDVRILTAGLSDVPLMRFASHHVYAQFLKAGIRIYEYFGSTLHAKTAAIDGVYASIGSYNLDHWSARRNLEVNVSMVDPNLTEQLESQFQVDVKASREIRLPEWESRSSLQRFLNFLAYQLMRL
ncbi:MAG: hypothetical protein I8H75_06090 [Myxococcaceae bacterium]|nr:hypothetical protein [Myxococcaceae bacterium]MBH2006886.1 hypothetical protein [Myxococcaceae bacterium]